jgi:hydroxymethylpyrimidine/phosphomethylpyrimidine kinase
LMIRSTEEDLASAADIANVCVTVGQSRSETEPFEKIQKYLVSGEAIHVSTSRVKAHNHTHGRTNVLTSSCARDKL